MAKAARGVECFFRDEVLKSSSMTNDSPKNLHDSIGLTDFKIPLSKLQPLLSFQNRDGMELSYRFYPTWSDRLLVFYHGIGGDSRYICALADAVAKSGIAAVLTPDLRGHGKSRMTVADVAGPDSLRDDLQDLLLHIEVRYPDKQLYLGGHSLGGGFALKAMADEILQKYFQGAVAISPYLHAVFMEDGGQRFASWLNLDPDKKIISLQMPENYKSGSEVLAYTVAFFEAASLAGQIEVSDLLSIKHLALIASTGDKISPATRYEKILADTSTKLHILDGYSHMGEVMSPVALQEIIKIVKHEFLWE
jgi:non-heme chloroperoxidase